MSFDAYPNSGADPIGITVKVDSVVVTNVPLTALNGACASTTSLQTGAIAGGVAGLCWQPILIELDAEGQLSVSYKGTKFVNALPVNFRPSPGRFIIAGRTGGSYQEQDIDNIRISTTTPTTPIVSAPFGNGVGFRLSIVDQGAAAPNPETIALTLNGASVPVTSVTRVEDAVNGNYYVVTHQNPDAILAPGSVNTVGVRFTGTGFEGQVEDTGTFTVPNYTLLTSAHKAPGAVNPELTGFTGRVFQLPVARAGDLVTIERHLANAIIDPGSGQPYENYAFPTDFVLDFINWTDANTPTGLFSTAQPEPQNVADTFVPGIADPAYTDNISTEVLTILNLPKGAYQLGVNHDDGFKLTAGAEPRDPFSATLLASAAANRDDSTINIVVNEAGYYPFRIAWGENTGLANLEFYITDFASGKRYLINQPDAPDAPRAFRDIAALNQPYVTYVSPGPGEVGILNTAPITVRIRNGASATVDLQSVTLSANGQGTGTATQNGDEITVTLENPATPVGAQSTATLTYRLSTGETITRTWNYRVSFVGQVLFNIQLNEGQGRTFVDSAQGLVGTFLTDAPLWESGLSGAPNDFAMRFTGAGGSRGSMPDPNRLVTLGPDWTGANGDYTAQCWVKLPEGFTPTVRMILFAYEGLPGFAVSINTGRTLHTTTYGLNDLNSTVVVPNDGQWHHVAVVHKNGVSMNFYLDGVLGQELAYTRGPGQRTNPAVTIGSASNGNNPTTGTIDRLMFIKGALTAEQLDSVRPTAPVEIDVSFADGAIVLSWPTAGGNYKLVSTTALIGSGAGTQWADAPETPTVANGTATVSIPATGTARFFRVEKVQ